MIWDEFIYNASSIQVLDSKQRLGATDKVGYPSIRQHPFFHGLDFESLHSQTPPQIYPYLPGTSEHAEMRSHYRVPDHLEPGLDDRQLTRLLGLDLGSQTEAEPEPQHQKPRRKTGVADLSPEEIRRKLEQQQRESKWHSLVQGNVVLKQGLVDKRKVSVVIRGR